MTTVLKLDTHAMLESMVYTKKTKGIALKLVR